ncbi:MAG: sulfite exporter TauE/SafE family protein [Planctomycetes bacterium]|nr:sulfite exporter TauE/SafE family protein [Planctomycetota bacterium]
MAALAASGLLGGMLGGFLGIGGTVAFMPLLKIICDANPATPLDPHTAIAATLVLNVCVGASATVGHARSGRIIGSVVKVLVPCSLAAGVAGVCVGNLFTGEAQAWLWRLFGLMMLYVVAVNVYRLIRPLAPVDAAPGDFAGPPPSPYAVGAVGLMTGFAAGLLGVGGGTVAVPAQQVLLKMRLRAAIANSAVAVAFSCALAAVIKHLWLSAHGADAARPWLFVGLMAPMAIGGALLGSHLTHRVGRLWVRLIFIAFLLWTAYEMLLAA